MTEPQPRRRGRPSIGERVTVRLPHDAIAELDAKAKSQGVPRAQLLRTLILDAIRSLTLLVVIGVGFIAATGGASAERPTVRQAAPMTADTARAPYGSGQIADWSGLTHTMSTPTRFETVAANNGVLIVGDSIANATSYECGTRFGQAGLTLAVNNWSGRPAEPAVDWLVANADYIPDRGVVMAVGANDIFMPSRWWEQVERVMDAADGKPVYWMSVHVDRWSGTADRRVADMRNSAWINDQLYAVARQHPNLVVVDWHAYLSEGYNESRVDAWLSDGVHPTTAGVDAWCDLLQARMGL